LGKGQKAPRIRRIIGAQVVDKAQMDQIPMLNSSNPDDLQAQLAAFLKQQQDVQKSPSKVPNGLIEDSSLQMPMINGRGVANNNSSNAS
tara:strand:- start:326 stop:592 length:267 start_codon:yes stop_codon:yes gene_type:complete